MPGMNIIGLMVSRNEDWVVGACIERALEWVDGMAVYVDRSQDNTTAMLDFHLSSSGKPYILKSVDTKHEFWDEMQIRHENLVDGRRLGGTHFAIIDADEILTANNVPHIRGWFKNLEPGQCLDLKMIPMRGLHEYQDDDSVWSRASVTIGFRDRSDLSHKPGKGGYQHHNRPPHGCLPNRSTPRHDGGVMHLQFANRRRLLAKHVLYRMVDHVRWPGRETVKQLNWKYSQALEPPDKVSPVPDEWWGAGGIQNEINLGGKPYQENEIIGMLQRYGPGAFEGLDLKGF